MTGGHLRTVWSIAAKDLRLRWRDRSVILVGLVGPVLLAAITSIAFRAVDSIQVRATIAFSDGDRGAVVAAFEAALQSPPLRDIVTLEPVPSEAAARQRVQAGKVDGAIVVPAGASGAAASEESAEVLVILAAGRPVGAAVTEAVGGALVQQLETQRLAAETRTRLGHDAEGSSPISAEALSAVILGDQRVGREHVNLASYYGPSMAIIFVFFTVSFGARSLWADRRLGLTQRVRSAPVSAAALVGGKALAVVLTGLASMLTIWLVDVLIFRATWGDVWGVSALLIAVVIAAIAVTMLLATLVRTEAQLETGLPLVVFMLALLGGSFIEIYRLPPAVRWISATTPNGWAMRGFTDLVAIGGGFGTVVRPVLAISAIALLCGSLALLRARRASFL